MASAHEYAEPDEDDDEHGEPRHPHPQDVLEVQRCAPDVVIRARCHSRIGH
jgi:hypothetical protein